VKFNTADGLVSRDQASLPFLLPGRHMDAAAHHSTITIPHCCQGYITVPLLLAPDPTVVCPPIALWREGYDSNSSAIEARAFLGKSLLLVVCFAIVILYEVVIGLGKSMVGAWVAVRNGKLRPGGEASGRRRGRR